MPPSVTPIKPQDDEPALTNQSTRFVGNVVHSSPVCTDPNCVLPACVNTKLLKSHLQKCKKKIEHCDICKQLKSGAQERETLMPDVLACPSLNPIKHCDVQLKEIITPDVQSDDEISIIKVVSSDNRRKKNLSEPRLSSQQMAPCDAVGNSSNSLEQSSCTAVIPLDHKPTISCSLQQQQQEQNSLIALQLNGAINPCNQIILPNLEVLCKALQALNTVIQLVKSSELEMHVIPLLDQALAEMKITALNRVDENRKPTPFPITSTPIVMEYCESDITGGENQWLPLQSVESPQLPPPSSASLLPPVGSVVTEWQSSGSSMMLSSAAAPYKANSVLELYEDVTDQVEFDQDTILLDFVEELLG